MKKKILMIAALFCCTMGTMTLVSCGDDDNSSTGDGGNTEAVAYREYKLIFQGSSTSQGNDYITATYTYPEYNGGATATEKTVTLNLKKDEKDSIVVRSTKFDGQTDVVSFKLAGNGNTPTEKVDCYFNITYRYTTYSASGKLKDDRRKTVLQQAYTGVKPEKWSNLVKILENKSVTLNLVANTDKSIDLTK